MRVYNSYVSVLAVVIPTLFEGKFLRNSVDSVLNSNYPKEGKEIDRSTTEEVLSRLPHSLYF